MFVSFYFHQEFLQKDTQHISAELSLILVFCRKLFQLSIPVSKTTISVKRQWQQVSSLTPFLDTPKYKKINKEKYTSKHYFLPGPFVFNGDQLHAICPAPTLPSHLCGRYIFPTDKCKLLLRAHTLSHAWCCTLLVSKPHIQATHYACLFHGCKKKAPGPLIQLVKKENKTILIIIHHFWNKFVQFSPAAKSCLLSYSSVNRCGNMSKQQNSQVKLLHYKLYIV